MVVGIIGIIGAIGIPSMMRMFDKEGMRKAVSDFVEACSHARAASIFSGGVAEVVMNTIEGTFSIQASSSSESSRALSFRGQFPPEVRIEIMGVNFIEMQEAEEARIRFFPNGTSDEFAMILRSDSGEFRKVTLDVVTGLVEVERVR